MRTSTLATLDNRAIADAFNAAYEGYVMPVNVGPAWAEQHVGANDIVLDASPLWLDDDGAVVGMAMLGVRGDRGWVGGFGIATAYRGRGLSHRLVEEVIERAARIGLHELQLEVITSNTAAIRVYERAGFSHRRDLLVLTRDPDATVLEIDTTAAQPADPALLIENRPQSATPPPWQREPRSLASSRDLEGLAIGLAEAPPAMVVYHVSEAAVRIADLAAIDQDAAQTLLAALIGREPGKAISIVNEPESSEALPALLDLGWREIMRQHEMDRAI